jgi:hypothetical protein
MFDYDKIFIGGGLDEGKGTRGKVPMRSHCISTGACISTRPPVCDVWPTAGPRKRGPATFRSSGPSG